MDRRPLFQSALAPSSKTPTACRPTPTTFLTWASTRKPSPFPYDFSVPPSDISEIQNSGTFSVAYFNSLTSVFAPHADSTQAMLGFNASPRYVEPQIGGGDGTDWPFFYEDKSNQFYVSIQKSFVP